MLFIVGFQLPMHSGYEYLGSCKCYLLLAFSFPCIRRINYFLSCKCYLFIFGFPCIRHISYCEFNYSGNFKLVRLFNCFYDLYLKQSIFLKFHKTLILYIYAFCLKNKVRLFNCFYDLFIKQSIF